MYTMNSDKRAQRSLPPLPAGYDQLGTLEASGWIPWIRRRDPPPSHTPLRIETWRTASERDSETTRQSASPGRPPLLLSPSPSPARQPDSQTRRERGRPRVPCAPLLACCSLGGGIHAPRLARSLACLPAAATAAAGVPDVQSECTYLKYQLTTMPSDLAWTWPA